MNLGELDGYTRDLTGIYATDVVTTNLMRRFINEGYKEVARRQGWPWLTSGTVADLTLTTDTPVFEAQYHALLSYRAAVKVLAFVNDDTNRIEFYANEFESMVKDLETDYLSGLATGSFTTLTHLTRLVRDVTGVYDNALMSDAMIKLYINQAYNEIARLRDWDWLENTVSVSMPAFTSGKHTINLSNGSRRVIEAYIVDPDNNSVEPMINTPSLISIKDDENLPRYDVTADGVFTFVPEQDSTYLVKVRYIQSWASLGDSDSPLFSTAFSMILVYRAAINVMAQIAPEDARLGVYSEEYASLLDGMVKHYELDHDSRTLQFNSEGINTKGYFPWFRPA